MADNEQEWIEKYRAAIETAPPIKKSRLKAVLNELGRVRNAVISIVKGLGDRANTLLSKSAPIPAPKPASTQTPVTALEQRHRSPTRSSKPVAVERPAAVVEQRRRAS